MVFRKQPVAGLQGPGLPNPASIEKLMPFAGGLWAFFGLALAGLLKEAILASQCGRLVAASGPVMVVIVSFFLANWIAIFVVQHIGVTYGMRDQMPMVRRIAMGGHLLSLGLHALISSAAALALRRAIDACPTG